MSIDIIKIEPLVLTITEEAASEIDTIDVGAAYTQYLHEQTGDWEHPTFAKILAARQDRGVRLGTPSHDSQRD